MRKYNINERGSEFNKIGNKRILQYLLFFPIVISFYSFLMIIGTNSKGGEYFSYIILFFGTSYIISIIISMIRKTNHRISSISEENNIIKLETFGWFFIKGKIVSANIGEIKIHPYKFRLTEKIEEEGWKLNINGKDYSLIKNFYDGDVESILRNSYTTKQSVD